MGSSLDSGISGIEAAAEAAIPSWRDRLAKRRAELEAWHESATLEELTAHYCPDTVHYSEWQRPWPPIPGDKGEDFESVRRVKILVAEAAENASQTPKDSPLRLSVPAECICDGLGWVGGNFELGHSDFGRLVPCACTFAKSNNTYVEWLWRKSGLNRSDAIPGFSTFDETRYEEGRTAKNAAIDWSQDSGPQWLVITGGPGVGKTMLAKAAAVAVLGHQRHVYYSSTLEFISAGRRRIGEGTYDQWLESIKRAEAVILDDVGQEYGTEWARSAIREVLHHRYEHRLRTLITSNFSIRDLADKLDTPTADRLRDVNLSKVINIHSKSLRGELLAPTPPTKSGNGQRPF